MPINIHTIIHKMRLVYLKCAWRTGIDAEASTPGQILGLPNSAFWPFAEVDHHAYRVGSSNINFSRRDTSRFLALQADPSTQGHRLRDAYAIFEE